MSKLPRLTEERKGKGRRADDVLAAQIQGHDLQLALLVKRIGAAESKMSGQLGISDQLLRKVHENSKAVVETENKTLRRVTQMLWGLVTFGFGLTMIAVEYFLTL